MARNNDCRSNMKPQISEFSYGFALTNELVGWMPLSVAPIFPSLIEEGKVGGGYDVKLDSPGVPLFLQFKRSHCMTRRSAREYKAVSASGGNLNIPYYRFPITEAPISDQHEMLMELDDGLNMVFYAAPRFHQLSEINAAWNTTSVVNRSIFISPNSIGTLDDKSHAVAFDEVNSWLCSEPQAIDVFSGHDLLNKLKNVVNEDSRPLRTRLSSLIEELGSAEIRGRERADTRRRYGEEEQSAGRQATHSKPTSEALEEQILSIPPESEPVETRDPKQLDGESSVLRKASDIAARVFDAQLIIVQSPQ